MDQDIDIHVTGIPLSFLNKIWIIMFAGRTRPPQQIVKIRNKTIRKNRNTKQNQRKSMKTKRKNQKAKYETGIEQYINIEGVWKAV